MGDALAAAVIAGITPDVYRRRNPYGLPQSWCNFCESQWEIPYRWTPSTDEPHLGLSEALAGGESHRDGCPVRLAREALGLPLDGSNPGDPPLDEVERESRAAIKRAMALKPTEEHLRETT